MGVRYVLHKVNPYALTAETRWQRFAVLEYTDFGDGEHLTNCRYFESQGEAVAYKARLEASQANTDGPQARGDQTKNSENDDYRPDHGAIRGEFL